MKIAVIGYSGGGKSTLARRLGEHFGAEVLHLDSVHWLPGWQSRPREESRQIVADFLDSHDAWVIDGNYSRLCYERRMEEADRIVFVNVGRLRCLWRAMKRYRQNRGHTRADMGRDCPEKMDAEFVKWILHDGRTAEIRRHNADVCRLYADKVTVIRNNRDLAAFWKTI